MRRLFTSTIDTYSLSNRENTADIGPQRLGALFCSPNSLADVGMCADVFGDFGIIFVLSVFDIVPPPGSRETSGLPVIHSQLVH
jgi:hypothetical protein